MNQRSRTLSNTLFASVGMYTEYLLGMLTSIVIARHLGPESFGTYSLVIWLVGLGVAITNSGTASAAIKFVAEQRGSESTELIPHLLSYLRRAQRWFLLVVVLGGTALFVFAGERIAPGMNHRLLLGFLVVAVALRSSYMFNIGVAKGFESFRTTASISLISTPINLVLVLLAVWRNAPVEWLLAVFVTSSVVCVGVSLRRVRLLLPEKRTGVKLPPQLLARVHRHMLWTALTVSVSFFAASEVEVMFLNMYTDSHDAGQFKVAYQLATGAAMLVPGVFSALLLPMMARALSRGREVAARRFVGTTSYLALLAAPLMAFGLVFGSDAIRFMYGVEYVAAGPVFAACLIATCISTMSSSASSLLVSADRQRSILLMVLTCGVVKLGLGMALVQRFGLHGAAAAFLGAACFSAIVFFSMAIRVSRIQPEWGRLVRILLAAGVAGIVALPLHGRLASLPSMLLGGVTLALVYALMTLALRCWYRGDIEHMQHLHQRFAAGRPYMGARLLQWACLHAPVEESP
jgi:O-antigen/teichoic acid export membrane protein